MDEYSGGRAAFGMRGAETAEAALAALPQRHRRLPHEPIGRAFAVFFGKVAADKDNLAGKCLRDCGGPLIEATQDIDQAVSRNGFQRGRRS